MTSESRKPEGAPPDPEWWTRGKPALSGEEPTPASAKTPVTGAVNRTTYGSGKRATRANEAGSHRTPRPNPKHAKLTLDNDLRSPAPVRCPSCSRANPPEAFYCHFDGKPLFKDLQPTPLRMGSLPFPTPFCFSRGQACGNFNQLALSCNNLWEEARELLTEGIWSTFFAAMGRLDLAAAAKEAAKLPDPDRGLAQLLERFPADPDFLRPPTVAAGSPEIDLGSLTPGTDYTFDLVVRNEGMLLLHGTALSNFDWLVFSDEVKPFAPQGPQSARACPQPVLSGEPPRTSQKMFQTRLGCTIPVLVLGSKLRAGLKPLTGDIILDTNGGAISVPVRAAVPIRPFPKGANPGDLLAGVRSPRELAVRAKKAPKEAGLLFEQGAVKAWYGSNGWTYPIEGANAQGTAAVQQFFEALGLTDAPRLEIDTDCLTFTGRAGETWVAQVSVRTRERKPVYAQVWSDQGWVKAGPVKVLGNRVQVPVEITVPADAGPTAQAQVTILGNARQRFVVPVTVTVENR